MKKILFAFYHRDDFPTIEPLPLPLARRGAEAFLCNSYLPRFRFKTSNWKTIFPKPSRIKDSNKEYLSQVLSPLARGILNKRYGSNTVIEHLHSYQTDIPPFLERTLQTLKPDLVVLSLSEVESMLARDACKRFSVKYCYLLPQYFEFKTLGYFKIEPVPYLVAGEEGKERLIRKGARPEQIFVTGNASYDKVFRILKKKIPKDTSHKTILFAQQNRSEDAILMDLLKRYLSRRKTVRWVNRPHPTELSGKRRSFAQSQSLHSDLLKSDVLVTASSLTLLDAIVLNVPALSFKCDYFPEEISFADHGDVLPARNYGELEKFLDLILFDSEFRRVWRKSREDASKKYLSQGDDPAAEKIAEVLLDLAS
ncbi:MAG: hypothetical protein HYZ85_01370 [Candidatus Omnitrophica bacterium]|nr:hypothetical protein [Candidatus Omnitrophota bacterium]